jgi:thioredoxin-like negative regulator of GroEL
MWPFDPNKQDMYQRYAQAYNTGDYRNLDPNEAQQQMQQFVQNAPPQEQEEVFRQHFSQMPADQRAQIAQQFPPEYGANPNDPASMAHAMARVSQERPDVAQRILAHPILLAASVGLAAIVARHMLDKRGQ